jgi:Ser/Thr protein kinase RdoA (MazF antagonist)
VFIHGDLQIVHVFVDGDEVSGVVDWSEGGQGNAMYDLATLTLARGAPRRCRRGLWRRHRDRRDSRVLGSPYPNGNNSR